MSEQRVYREPKKSAGPNYPDSDTPIDEAKPNSVSLGESNPPTIIKHQQFWNEAPKEDDTWWEQPLTKREFADAMDTWWQNKKREQVSFWDESDPNKKSENLVQRANRELADTYERKVKTGEESRLNYSEELRKMMAGEAYLSQSDRDNLVQAAFREVGQSFVDGGILSPNQAKHLLSVNAKAGAPHFFRGKRRQRN
jgi:hypothetical protein